MEWAKGYVADIGYTSGFYRECNPAHMAFAALTTGRSPGLAFRPKQVLELGFGQGFGLSLLAAANPDIAFTGYDFNPEHVANAQRLVQSAGLSNLTVSEASFEEVAAQPGENDLNVITLHGIFSWIAREGQDAIVAIARQRLKPFGVLYVSYNSMPGWAALAPIRQFILEVKRRNPSRASERQLTLALDLLKKLKEGGAAFFTANPPAAQHLDTILKSPNRVYLAHEYLDEHWDSFPFVEVAARLAEAKLSFLCSATLPENINTYTCPPNLLPLLAETDDPSMRETLRDYAVNKRFRRDVFARGSASPTPPELSRLWSELRFALCVPRKFVTFKFPIPVGEVTVREEVYAPLVDRLAEKMASFDELLALPPFGDSKRGLLIDCLVLLVHSARFSSSIRPRSWTWNLLSASTAWSLTAQDTGQFYAYLASPVAGTGIHTTNIGLLTLSALLDGAGDDASAAAKHVLLLLKKTGGQLVDDGKTIGNKSEQQAFLEARMQPVLADLVPAWRRLGVL